MSADWGQLALFCHQPTSPVDRRSTLRRGLLMNDPTLADAVAVITDLWRADVATGDMSSQTCDRYCDLVARFAAYAARHEQASLDDAFSIYDQWLLSTGRDRAGQPAAPSLSTRHMRACAVRALYRTGRYLGWTTLHPSYVGREPNATTRQGRPLLRHEFQTIRSVASTMQRTRHAAAVAIALSGGGTADIGAITRADVDLDDGTLCLPGTRHIAARRVRIPGEWERNVLTQRLQDLAGCGDATDAGLVVRRTGSSQSRQAGAAIALSEVLQAAQLKSDPMLKPASLSRWAALVAFETSGDVAAAAALLGTNSLDTAASAIAWDWAAGPAVTYPVQPDYQPGVVK